MTRFLDSLVGEEVTSLNEIPISSVHWIRYIPAIFIGVLVSVFIFYLCKNLRAARYTKYLAYIASSLVVICVFLSGTWYKDPIYTLIFPEDDYYVPEKSNFLSSDGTALIWTDECVQSGRIVYCYVNLKNLSDKDRTVSVDTGDTFIITGEKAHVRAESAGKLGNQKRSRIYKSVTAPKNMTIVYGLKFELPEPTNYATIPNLRISMTISGYSDIYSMSNRPLKEVTGH
ncbi:hypothetical protein [Vibrio profundi]|uniref:hypothetical protein n=1 Tax=Vibrio profundi TaxID=1774960 RepID=UPI0037369DB4